MPARSKIVDPDVPPLSTERIMRMRPATEVLPQKLLDAQRRRREAAEAANDPPLPPLNEPKKQAISIRLDSDVIEQLRASGADWQSRVNDILRKSLGL